MISIARRLTTRRFGTSTRTVFAPFFGLRAGSSWKYYCTGSQKARCRVASNRTRMTGVPGRLGGRAGVLARRAGNPWWFVREQEDDTEASAGWGRKWARPLKASRRADWPRGRVDPPGGGATTLGFKGGMSNRFLASVVPECRHVAQRRDIALQSSVRSIQVLPRHGSYSPCRGNRTLITSCRRQVLSGNWSSRCCRSTCFRRR